MPRNCLYCGMYDQAGNSNLSLHQFPVDIARRKTWFSALGKDYDERRFIYLCCNHFSSNDFELSSLGLLRLKKTAIPCVAGFSATFLKVSLSEDDCSIVELSQRVPKDQNDEQMKNSPGDNVIREKRIFPQRSILKSSKKRKSPITIPSNGNKNGFKGFSRDQQIQPIQSSSSYSSGDLAVEKKNTENIRNYIELEHDYGKSSNSEINIVDESETDTGEETDFRTEKKQERDVKTEHEDEIIIIDPVDDFCQKQTKKDNRTGYNNPKWLMKKIENQQKQMKFFEKKNLDLRCKIIDMKVSLGLTGKNMKRLDTVKVKDAPVAQYPGFQEMLKQASIQQLDRDTAIKTIFKSVNEVKLKNYDNAFKKWLEFCSENNVKIFEPKISEVLDFFRALLAPGTMNYNGFVIYERAILGILGDDKASDKQLKQFLEELNVLFNSFQRQNHTWDPHVLLLHLSRQYPNEIIGLDDLSRKVVTLLALVTKVGLQGFAELKLEDVTVTGTEVQISLIDFRIGTVSTSHRTIVKLPFFEETPQLCIASTLTYYIKQSSKIRKFNEKSLFIECEYPYKAASITTLNSWIRQSMMRAGVEFSMFSDLSENLNSLKDHQNEILFDEIKRRVKWTDDMLIFTHFYNL